MANLSLKTRRGLARGYSRRAVGTFLGRRTMGDGNRASLTTNLAGANNDIQFRSKAVGASGNSTTITYAVAGNNTPLSISVVGSAITVNVATNGAGAATSTARDIARAINSDRSAGPLVWANSHFSNNDGTGVVIAMTATALSGATAEPRY